MKSIVESIKAVNEGKTTWWFDDMQGINNVNAKFGIDSKAKWLIILPEDHMITAITDVDLSRQIEEGDDADWHSISIAINKLKVGESYIAKDDDGDSLGTYVRIA